MSHRNTSFPRIPHYFSSYRRRAAALHKGRLYRSPQKQLRAIRQGKIPAVCSRRAILRLVPVDDDLLPYLNGILGDASPHQDVRAARFDRPVFNLAVGALHVDIDPAVRIDQLHPRNGGIWKLTGLFASNSAENA